MSIVILEFEYDYYLMECPAFVAESIQEYQMKFDSWMSDKSNDHGYWTAYPPKNLYPDHDPYEPRDSDGKDALSYGEDAFVDWLNRFVLQDENEKAKIISAHDIEERDDKNNAKFPRGYNKYPHLFF